MKTLDVPPYEIYLSFSIDETRAAYERAAFLM
jgi:hypothetical protein